VGGKKHIPKDLKITPNLCLHCWMGDGSLMNRINGILCSECFDKGEQENLCLKLNKEIGINSHLVKYKNSYRIFLISKDIKKFLEYIGNPPFNEISYKWNYRGNI
jgi:reverse gyrase